MSTDRQGRPAGVDLDEVARLVDALERDLERARTGAANVEILRREVDELRRVLDASAQGSSGLQDKLHSVRDRLQKAEQELVSDARAVGEYVTRIGRMLGM
jgi:cell division septum initiation protein DivIVA